MPATCNPSETFAKADTSLTHMYRVFIVSVRSYFAAMELVQSVYSGTRAPLHSRYIMPQMEFAVCEQNHLVGIKRRLKLMDLVVHLSIASVVHGCNL